MENLNINKFSAPMPFMPEHIELLAKINEKHSTSKITMLYNCLPANAIDCSGFEQLRCHDDRIKSLNDLIPLVQLSHSLGMDFTYLLNSVNTPHPDIFRKEQWKINRGNISTEFINRKNQTSKRNFRFWTRFNNEND